MGTRRQGRSGRWCAGRAGLRGGRLEVQSAIDVATMTHDCDGDDTGLVVYRIDDPVITGSYPDPRRMTLEGFSTYGSRFAGKGAHLCQHVLPDLGVKLAQTLRTRGRASTV